MKNFLQVLTQIHKQLPFAGMPNVRENLTYLVGVLIKEVESDVSHNHCLMCGGAGYVLHNGVQPCPEKRLPPPPLTQLVMLTLTEATLIGEALSEGLENCGDDPECVFAEPARVLERAIEVAS